MRPRVGKTRRKLAELLQGLADEMFGKGHFYVAPECIEQNQLTYRTRLFDAISWEVSMQRTDKAPFQARFYSWDTMGSICRHGVAVVKVEGSLPGDVEVCADEKA